MAPDASEVFFLTKRQLCAKLQISLATLNRHLADGSIKHIKLGQVVRIPSTELDKLMVCGDD